MACIRKRRGRYVLDFYDQYGKRQRVTTEKGTTKKSADEEMRRTLDAVSDGVYTPAKRMPLFSKVAEEWLEHKKTSLRITSWEVCEGHTQNHFTELSDLKIGQITVAVVEKWIRKRQEEEMNLATIRKILVTLGQIMGYAVRHRYISHNPVRDAERPRDQGHEERKKIRILTPAEINALLDKTEGQKYRTLFMLAIFSGARQGELLGLKWGDLEWENRQIHIQRTFNNGRFFATKTRDSNRKIDIGPTVLQELRKWKLACPPNELDLVFPCPCSKPWEGAQHSKEKWGPIDHHNLVNRHYLPALRRAGLLPEKKRKVRTKGKSESVEQVKPEKKEPKKKETIRFHDLRHTYASLLIEQGENLKYIQTQLGHSSPTVTLNVYAHLMKPTNQEAACRLENSILGTTGHNLVTIQEKGVTA